MRKRFIKKCNVLFLDRRAVSDWVQTLVSLVIAGIGLLILFMYVISQFGILTNGTRKDDAARVGFESFTKLMNDITINGEDFSIVRHVPLTIGEPYYAILSFPNTQSLSGIGAETEKGIGLENFDGSDTYTVPRPELCGENCFCLYKRELLSDDPAKDLLECASTNADYVVTRTLVEKRLDKNFRSGVRNVIVDAKDVRTLSLKGFDGEYYTDTLQKDLKKYNDYIDANIRFFTAGTSKSVGMNTAGKLISQGMDYYVEKTVQNGETFLLILPEDAYTEERAVLFKEEYGDPAEVLQEYIQKNDDVKHIITYADKKLPVLIEQLKGSTTEKNKDSRDTIEKFVKLYLEYLQVHSNEKIVDDTTKSETLLVTTAINILNYLLTQSGSEDFVRYEAVNLYEFIEKSSFTTVTGAPLQDVELHRTELYENSLNAVQTLERSSGYSLLYTIVSQPKLWGDWVIMNEQESPQKIFVVLQDMTKKETGLKQQQAFYLLGLAYKNYRVREDVMKDIVQRYDLAVQSFKSAFAIDPTTSIAEQSRQEQLKICTLGNEQIGKDGVTACA